MNLSIGKIITRNKVLAVPLPSTVKQQLEEMALEQGLESVKFTNKVGVEFPNIKDRCCTK